MRKTLELIAGAIFPRDIYCICCGSIIDSSRTYSLCDSCITRFHWIPVDDGTGSDKKYTDAKEHLCKKCGKVLSAGDPQLFCFDCKTLDHYFDRGYTCCQYDIYSRAIVMDLKYRDKSYIAAAVGDILADRMMMEYEDPESRCAEHDIVIPVPVSDERMKKRGYNQAALIARRFSKRTGIAIDETILLRNEKTHAMKDLDAAQRRLNVRGAFSIREKEMWKIKEKRLLLIDDIYTTGATVSECARVLKEAGAERVDVLTLAAGANRIPEQGKNPDRIE